MLQALALAAVLAAPSHAGSIPDASGKQVFLRGVGWSPWHVDVGWALTPEITAQDRAILRRMRVNALRSWGRVTRATSDAWHAEGFYWLPQVHMLKTPKGQYKSGDPSRTPIWTAKQSLALMRETATALATELKDAPGIVGYNLGNEYSSVGQDKSKNWGYGGFDEATIAAFRAWLESRFPSAEAYEKHYGEPPPDFDTYLPPTGTTSDTMYGEWRAFQREQGRLFFQAGHEACKAVDPRRLTTYARLCGGRWDPVTEDLVLDFSETVGDNLYWMWDRDWYKYCTRLSRHAGTGPGKPMLLTETGVRATSGDERAARLLKQMLVCGVLHPEVAGIFIFEYCDEWYNAAGDPKSHDASKEANWGLVTAGREPKRVSQAVTEVYSTFEEMNDFIVGTKPSPTVIVSGQETDSWRGSESVSHMAVCEQLYRNGVEFGLWGDLALTGLDPAVCRKLILTDTHLWAEPDGSADVCEAVLEFAREGGQVLYLCTDPFRKVGGYHDVPADLRDADGFVQCDRGGFTIVREPLEGRGLWRVIRKFLSDELSIRPVHDIRAEGVEDLIWRVLTSGREQKLIIVNAAEEPLKDARIRLRSGDEIALPEIDAYAIIDLPK
ncbi:MAG TPA: hypothetical protein QGH10_02010 [Armatimonadota bacterium]|nr:hypothetical protein [Armatimonadota bacterium]